MTLDLGELVARARIDTAPFRTGLRDLDQVMTRTGRDWESTMRAGGTRAGQAGGDGITRGVRDGARGADRAVDQAATGWRATTVRAGEQAGEAGGRSLSDALAEKVEGVKDRIGSILSGDLKAAGFGVAGAAIGGAIVMGISDAMAQANLAAELTGQLGLTKKQSEQVGKAAGQLFANGYGEGLDEIGEALKGVTRNIEGMRDAGSDALATVTGQAMTTAKVLGEDVSASARAAGQMIRTGLAKDATEAFDLLTAGAQKGVNAAEDISDTFIEYGTQFRKLGLDGTEAMGLLSQGMRDGARDADTVADAIKEFSIRAIDGSDASAAAFEQLGLSAQDMITQIASGGPAAKAGLDTVLDKLRAVQDPAEQSAIAVGLFGTKAEDLGQALYGLDLDTAATDLGTVAGAADKANQAFNDTPAAKVSSFFRMIRQEGVDALGILITKGDAAADSLSGIGTKAKEMGAQAKGLWDSFPGPAREAATAIGAVMLANRLFGNQMQATQTRAANLGRALRDASTAQGAIVRTSAGQTVQMGRFGSSIQSLGTHVPAIQRVQTAFLNAATAAERFPRAAGAAAAGMTVLKGAGSGLMNAIGGPFGLALLAGGAALMVWQRHQRDAAQAAAESKARVQELTGTLDKNTGAITSNTRASVADTLQKNGAAKAAKQLGIDLADLTDAALGNPAAMKAVQDQIDGITTAYKEQTAGAEDVANQSGDVADAMSKVESAISGSNREVRAAKGAQAEMNAMMKAGGAASKDATDKASAYARAQEDLTGKTNAAKVAQDNLTKAINDTTNAFLGGRASERDYRDSIDAVTQALKDNGKTLDPMTEKGRANGAVLDNIATKTLGVIKGYRDSGMSAEELAKKLPGLRTELEKQAGRFGLNEQAAKKYATDALGKIPTEITTTVKADLAAAKAKVKELGYDYDTLPKSVTSKITVDEEGGTNAAAVLAAVGLNARNIPGKVTTVTSVPTAVASAALLSQLKNVAVDVDGTPVNITTAAPNAAAVQDALRKVEGAAVSADGKSVDIPTGSPTAPLTKLLLDNVAGAAYNADTKSVSVPTAAPGAINAATQIDGVTAAAFKVPPSKHTQLNATDNASGKADAVTRAVGNIPPSKTVRIDIVQQLRGYEFTGTASANGNILDSVGRVTRFAAGGFHGPRRENHQAQIAPAGAWRVWAEPETGGEAYIPLAASKRARSMKILARTAEMMGAQVIPRADGSVPGMGATTTTTTHYAPIIINGDVRTADPEAFEREAAQRRFLAGAGTRRAGG